MKYKIIEIYILILSLIISILAPINVIAAENNIDNFSAHTHALSLLQDLNILNNDQTQDFDENKKITRAELAQLVVNTLNLEAVETDSGINFKDIDKSDKDFIYVSWVAALEIMNGYSDGTFRPEKPVLLKEAVKVLISVLGYDLYAQNKGGYPTGYLSIAAQYSITKDISIAGDEEISLGVTAQLIYNALEVPLMQQVSFGEDIQLVSNKKDTLLSKNLKIEKKEGQVTGTFMGRFGNNREMLKKQQIEIDFIIYDCFIKDMDKYIGKWVEYYVDIENDENIKQIFSIVEKKSINDIVVIEADRLSPETSKQKIIYYEDEDRDTDKHKKKELRISQVSNVIWNGKGIIGLDLILDELLQSFRYGSLTCIDSNSDGEYDVVIIKSYRTSVVERILEEGKRIYDKYNNNTIELDADDRDLRYRLLLEGNEIEFNEINKDAVLLVADSRDVMQVNQDEVVYTEVLVSNNIENGVISEVSENEITLNSKTYKKSDAYIESGDEFIPSTNGKVYIDAFGKIALFKHVKNEGWIYSYLIGSAITSGLSGKVQFKVFTETGDIVTYACADKVEIFNGSINKSEKIESRGILSVVIDNDGNIINQLIKLRLDNDGNIVALRFAVDCTNFNDPREKTSDPNALRQNFKILEPHPTNDISYARGSIMYVQPYFAQRYQITDNTVVFYIPPDKTKEKDYKIIKMNYFSEGSFYPVDIFDIDEYFRIPAMLYLPRSSGSVSTLKGKPFAIVKGKSRILNEDGESVDNLKLLYMGKEINATPIRDDLVGSRFYRSTSSSSTTFDILPDYPLSELKEGDIIQVSITQAGFIEGFILMDFMLDNNKYLESFNVNSDNWIKSRWWKDHIKTDVYHAKGEVLDVMLDKIIIRTMDTTTIEGTTYSGEKYYRIAPTKGPMKNAYFAYLIELDTTGKYKKTKSIPFSDIEKGDKVLLKLKNSIYGTEIIVFRVN